MVGRTDVVRIVAGKCRGTGFVIDKSRVLTALHVVGTVTTGVVSLHGPVILEGALDDGGRIRTIRSVLSSVEDMPFDDKLDWICLYVEGLEALARPHNRSPRATDINEEWRTYGFPKDASDTGKSVGGRFRSTGAAVEIRGVQRTVLQVHAHEIETGDDPGGFSGAPLFVGGEIVGMFFSAPERIGSGTMYALPVAPLLARIYAPAGRRPLTLCYAELSLPGCSAAAALITDDPDRLATAVSTWPSWLATSALRSNPEVARIRSATLDTLLADPPLRRELLQRKFSTTSFELYVHYAPTPDPRIRASLLFQRLRKRKGPPIAHIVSREMVTSDVSEAITRIAAEDHHIVKPPTVERGRAALASLTNLALRIVARRLAEPDNPEASAELELVRTRLRLVLDVITGKIHRRERNPLP